MLKSTGKKRTSKGVAPVQTDSDYAFGTRKAKCFGADLQAESWDTNALLQTPLYTRVCVPQDRSVRARGEFGLADFNKKLFAETATQQSGVPHEDVTWALERIMEGAANV